jgi:hypothetical protein
VELYGNAIDDSGRFLDGTESSRGYAQSWEAQHHRQGHPHQQQEEEEKIYQQYEQEQQQQYQQYQQEQQQPQQQQQQQQEQEKRQYYPYVPRPAPSAPFLADLYSQSSHAHSRQSSLAHSVQSSLGYGKNGRALSDSHFFAEAEEEEEESRGEDDDKSRDAEGESRGEEEEEEEESRGEAEEENESREEEEGEEENEGDGMSNQDYRAPGPWASEKERIEAMGGLWAGAKMTGQVRAEGAGNVEEQDRDVYEFERRMGEHVPEDAGDVYEFGNAIEGVSELLMTDLDGSQVCVYVCVCVRARYTTLTFLIVTCLSAL